MIKLENLIQRAKEHNGIVYIKEGDILVIEAGYIDTRETFKLEHNIHFVKPVTFHNGYYWYVCPDCSKLHCSDKLGKIETGCCLDIDCTRHQYFNGTHFIVQRTPIILEDEF